MLSLAIFETIMCWSKLLFTLKKWGDIYTNSLNCGASESVSNGFYFPNSSWIDLAVYSFSLSHPFCLFSNLVFPNHGQGSECVCCACIFALLPTLHHCPLMFFPSLLLLSSSLLLWLVLEKELHASTLLDKTDGSSIALASIAGLTGVEPNR